MFLTVASVRSHDAVADAGLVALTDHSCTFSNRRPIASMPECYKADMKPPRWLDKMGSSALNGMSEYLRWICPMCVNLGRRSGV